MDPKYIMIFWSCFLILWDPARPPSFCKCVSSSLRSFSSSSRRRLSSLSRATSSRQLELIADSHNQHRWNAKHWPQIMIFWSCFLILWDPAKPPSFCKCVSSSLRSFSSSSRRSLSSWSQLAQNSRILVFSSYSRDPARVNAFDQRNRTNVGYRLVWGYTIVSTDLKIIV